MKTFRVRVRLHDVEKANEKMDKNTPIEEKYDKQISFIKELIQN